MAAWVVGCGVTSVGTMDAVGDASTIVVAVGSLGACVAVGFTWVGIGVLVKVGAC